MLSPSTSKNRRRKFEKEVENMFLKNEFDKYQNSAKSDGNFETVQFSSEGRRKGLGKLLTCTLLNKRGVDTIS